MQFGISGARFGARARVSSVQIDAGKIPVFCVYMELHLRVSRKAAWNFESKKACFGDDRVWWVTEYFCVRKVLGCGVDKCGWYVVIYVNLYKEVWKINARCRCFVRVLSVPKCQSSFMLVIGPI